MNGFYAIILTEQLDDPDINYLDLLYTAPELAGLPTEPYWNPFQQYGRIVRDKFDITRNDLIDVETTIQTNSVSGTICDLVAV